MIKTGAQHIEMLKDGRQVYINGAVGRRRHRASSLPPDNPVDRRALRFPGATRKPGTDDLRSSRKRRAAGQPYLAVAAQPRRPRRAAQGAGSLDRTSLRVSWPRAGPCRFLHFRHVHGDRASSRPMTRTAPPHLPTITATPGTTNSISPTSSSIRRPTARSPQASSRIRFLTAGVVDQDADRLDDPRRQDARHRAASWQTRYSSPASSRCARATSPMQCPSPCR